MAVDNASVAHTISCTVVSTGVTSMTKQRHLWELLDMSDDKNPIEWTKRLTYINQPFIFFMVSDAGFEPPTPAVRMPTATVLAFSFFH